MQMIFHSHANKTHFHKKGCALGLILKVRVFGIRQWPIAFDIDVYKGCGSARVGGSGVNELTRQEFSSTSHPLRHPGGHLLQIEVGGSGSE